MTALRPTAITIVFLALCLAFGQGAFCQEQPTSLQPLTLDQAVDTTLGNSTTLKNSELDVAMSKDKLAEARTNYFPKVRFSAVGLQLITPLNFRFDKGVFGDFPATGPIPDQNTSVTTQQRPLLFVNTLIAQPLLHFGRVGVGVRQSELAIAVAQQKLRLQKSEVTNQIKHAYYKALELQDSLQVIEATANLLREVGRTTAEYLSRKAILKSDAIEVEQQVANAEYEATRLRNAVASQKEEMNHLLGRDIQTDFSLVMVQEPPSLQLDLPAAQAHAMSARPELKQLSSQSRQIALERRMKQLQYLPDLNLVFDYLSMFGTQVIPKNVVVVGLFLNWEPLDWGLKHFERREKGRLLEQTNNSLKEMEKQVTLQVNVAYRKLQEARQYVHVTELGRQLALEKMRVAANKYKEKAALLKDVLQAQKDLTQANNQYTQSMLSLSTARADFEHAVGED